MSTGRNRATGWLHAKLSGHENENDVELLFQDQTFCDEFSNRLGVGKIVQASVGGLKEKDVQSVLGDKTKSKTDLHLVLEDGQVINISIKKSSAGQVFLIGVERFIEGFESHYSCAIPDDVKEALYLFFYGHSETMKILNDKSIVGGQNDKKIKHQRKRNRLTVESLRAYNQSLADSLLQWFIDNRGELAEYCFSLGLALEERDWADYVWYINMLGEDDFDEIYSVKDIVKYVAESSDKVFFGNTLGGTTIQLPFGFVQWHQKQIQFHHKLNKLRELMPDSI